MYCDSCARLARSTCCRRTRGFGVAQAARHRPGQQRHQEYDATQDAGGGVVGGSGGMGYVAADLLHQQGQGRQRRQQEGVAAVGEQGHGAHRDHEQDAESAGHAAAREHQQADGHRVHHRMHEGGCTQIGQQPSAADDDGDAGGEIDDAGPEEQFRPGRAERRFRTAEGVQGVDRRRNQQSIEIYQADDAPGEIGRGGRNCGERHRSRLYQQE